MTRRIAAVLALFLTLVALPVAAAIQLRLRAEPQSALPAIAPSLRVEAINTGSEPAELPLRIALQVTPSGDAKPFVAYTGPRGDDKVTAFWTEGETESIPIVLAPKETRDVSFWAGPESPLWFTADSRLMSPGMYRLQLVADRGLNSERMERVERAIDQPGLIDPIVSNETTFVVETPKGDDAAVWELIRNQQTPGFWMDTVQLEIWRKYPNSRYAAYCLNTDTHPAPEIAIAAYNAALAKGPSPIWTDWYRKNIAFYELQRARAFVAARDVESAVAASDRARSILTQLAKQTPNPALRQKAEQMLRNVWTRESMIEHIKWANGELNETRPHELCVEKTAGGKHVFWFAYNNLSLKAMTIPIGPENKFTPPPFDRGQPTIFPVGDRVLGVRIETEEPALTWHLQKYNVQASVEKTPPCPTHIFKEYRYEPPRRE